MGWSVAKVRTIVSAISSFEPERLQHLYCLDKQARYDEGFASDEAILLKSITEHGCGDKANGAGNVPTYE